MSHNFRIENVKGNDRFIKVYPKTNDELPVKVDVDRRYCIQLATIEPFLEKIQNFEVREDDVWVITVPKCGTTWMLELSWLLVNNLNFEAALSVEQEQRCPYLEYCMAIPTYNSIDELANIKSPRVIKTHLPLHILPKALWTLKPKIIYVTRDPKDLIVSQYHYFTALGLTKRSKDEIVSAMLCDSLPWNPFWEHVVDFWKIRKEPNIYFTSYERMKIDLRKVVLQVSEFLQKPINDEQIENLCDHLSFKNMKDNPMCNHVTETKLIQTFYSVEENNFRFVRKGVIGSHKEELSSEAIIKFNQWTKRSLEPFGVTSDDIFFS